MNNRIITIIVSVLSIVGIGLFILTLGTEEKSPEQADAVSNLVTYSLIFLIIAAAAAVLVSLLSLVKNPAALKKAGLGLLALVAVFAISYMFANGSEVVDTTGKVLAAAESQVSKLTSTGIWFSGLLMLGAGAFFVWDLLKGLIKS